MSSVKLTVSVVTPDPIHWKTRWSNEEGMIDVTDEIDKMISEKIIRQTGVLLDSILGKEYTKTASNGVEAIDEAVLAVLVYKDSQEGCVRVVGQTVKNTITGQGGDNRRLIVFIDSAKGEKGWIYGQPRVRFYRRSNGMEK